MPLPTTCEEYEIDFPVDYSKLDARYGAMIQVVGNISLFKKHMQELLNQIPE